MNRFKSFIQKLKSRTNRKSILKSKKFKIWITNRRLLIVSTTRLVTGNLASKQTLLKGFFERSALEEALFVWSALASDRKKVKELTSVSPRISSGFLFRQYLTSLVSSVSWSCWTNLYQFKVRIHRYTPIIWWNLMWGRKIISTQRNSHIQKVLFGGHLANEMVLTQNFWVYFSPSFWTNSAWRLQCSSALWSAAVRSKTAKIFEPNRFKEIGVPIIVYRKRVLLRFKQLSKRLRLATSFKQSEAQRMCSQIGVLINWFPKWIMHCMYSRFKRESFDTLVIENLKTGGWL